uniref:Uncharacterized protein n=1 Tax=Arundo donax TaxID=35708 RepID=A0A0A9AXA2_ARUDO
MHTLICDLVIPKAWKFVNKNQSGQMQNWFCSGKSHLNERR